MGIGNFIVTKCVCVLLGLACVLFEIQSPITTRLLKKYVESKNIASVLFSKLFFSKCSSLSCRQPPFHCRLANF